MGSTNEQLYCEKALALGASDVVVLAPEAIVLEPELVEHCGSGHCPGYGRCGNCPPHSMTPEQFADFRRHYQSAVIFRIIVPSEILSADDTRKEIAGFVHKTAADIEQYAIALGDKAKGFAGGPCREIFCGEYSTCRVLDDFDACRYPTSARNSMSGLGINFQKLNKIIGWNETLAGDGTTDSTGMMVGMILVG